MLGNVLEHNPSAFLPRDKPMPQRYADMCRLLTNQYINSDDDEYGSLGIYPQPSSFEDK